MLEGNVMSSTFLHILPTCKSEKHRINIIMSYNVVATDLYFITWSTICINPIT